MNFYNKVYCRSRHEVWGEVIDEVYDKINHKNYDEVYDKVKNEVREKVIDEVCYNVYFKVCRVTKLYTIKTVTKKVYKICF